MYFINKHGIILYAHLFPHDLFIYFCFLFIFIWSIIALQCVMLTLFLIKEENNHAKYL